MSSASKHNSHSLTVNDRVAKMLSGIIVKAQKKLALRFSVHFNNYSVRKQKSLLLIAGVLMTAILITGLFTKGYTIPAIKQTYKPATHIGMASDIDRPQGSDVQLTDSLTKNH